MTLLNTLSKSHDSSSKHQHNRNLGSGDYLVDYYGNELPALSLSWRYLGVYIDTNCKSNNRRILNNNYYNYYSGACRKVLWAAYHDPEYEGQGIAEYSLYERESGNYDKSTCHPNTYGLYFEGSRCRRLDCHEASTQLELVGVFKETDGLYDFTEQLFKHQGYCVWDGDKQNNAYDNKESSDYNFMHNMSEKWVQECTQLKYATDAQGNSLYYDTKPLPGGDLTYGVYIDADCTVESKLSYSDVLDKSYQGSNSLPSINAIDRWNDLLNDYKVCQPCRAYNRVQVDDVTQYDDEDYDDGDDGEGGKDPWGYNCYDDAGYTNCHQCYKFVSQTNMEVASTEDLELASKQGTILGVTVDGVNYGKGTYGKGSYSSREIKLRRGRNIFMTILLSVLVLLLCVTLLMTGRRRNIRRRKSRKSDRNVKHKRARRQKRKIRNQELEKAILEPEDKSSKIASFKISRSRSRSKSVTSKGSRKHSRSRSGRGIALI